MSEFAKYIAAMPQERPFLFIDEIESLTYRETVVGYVTFPVDHPVFQGHLPGNPIVPGVILNEALAQISGLVMIREGSDTVLGYLAETRRMRFRRLVRPGERVRLRATLERSLASAAMFDVEARVGDEIAAEGSITVGGMKS